MIHPIWELQKRECHESRLRRAHQGQVPQTCPELERGCQIILLERVRQMLQEQVIQKWNHQKERVPVIRTEPALELIQKSLRQ